LTDLLADELSAHPHQKKMNVQNINTSSLEVKYGLRIDSELETRQLGRSKQDHVAHGNYPSSSDFSSVLDTHTYWLATFDGHGNNQAPNRIRSAPLDDIMEKPASWAHLQTFINSDDKADGQTKLKSGSTMVYAKAEVSPTGIEVTITNIGDSTAVVFLNGEPIFVTTQQDYENGAEMARLIKENRVNIQMPLVKQDSNFEVLSPNTLRSIEGTYIEFVSPEGRQTLSMSQCLGHGGITGLKPDVTVFKFNPTDTIKVVLFSDGVSDVMPVIGAVASSTIPFMTTPTSMLDEAERRWKQEWNVHSGTDLRKIYQTKFPKNGYDDCCCAMLTIQPAIVSVPPPLPPCIVESAQPKTDVEEDTDIYA
jgi:serine/threonine protein phosphatase PrpC